MVGPLISIIYFLFDVVQTEENDCLLGISPSFSQVFLPKMKFDVRQVSQHKTSLQFLFNSNQCCGTVTIFYGSGSTTLRLVPVFV
jgi:hypothetical protein